MKLNYLHVTNFLKKTLITIISLSVFFFPTLAFASDSVSDQEQTPLEVVDAPFYAPDLEMSRIMETAQEIKAAAATEYTTTDIYNLLYNAIRGSSTATTYSLPYIANRANSIYTRLGSMQTNDITTQGIIQDIYDDVHQALFGDSPYAMGIIAQLADMLDIEAGNSTYTVTELTGMIWSLVQDISSYSSISNSLLSSINSSITAVGSLDWQPARSFVSKGFTSDFQTFSTSTGYYGDQYYYAFTVGLYSNNVIFRLSIPVNDRQVFQFNDWDIALGRYYNNQFVDFDNVFLGYDYTYRTLYIYFIPLQTNQDTYVHLSNDQVYLWSSNFACDVLSIDDVQSYQFYNNLLIRSGFNSLDSIYGGVERLANYFVSPAKQAAETASDEVIDSTLDNFTGSGGGAAQRSDSNAMKDISVSVKSGINGGGSTSNATDVLNPSSVSGQTFWIWFSTTTKNNVENPYPAPVVNNTRKVSGDDIIDTLSGYQEQLQNLLGGDSK